MEHYMITKYSFFKLLPLLSQWWTGKMIFIYTGSRCCRFSVVYCQLFHFCSALVPCRWQLCGPVIRRYCSSKICSHNGVDRPCSVRRSSSWWSDKTGTHNCHPSLCLSVCPSVYLFVYGAVAQQWRRPPPRGHRVTSHYMTSLITSSPAALSAPANRQKSIFAQCFCAAFYPAERKVEWVPLRYTESTLSTCRALHVELSTCIQKLNTFNFWIHVESSRFSTFRTFCPHCGDVSNMSTCRQTVWTNYRGQWRLSRKQIGVGGNTQIKLKLKKWNQRSNCSKTVK